MGITRWRSAKQNSLQNRLLHLRNRCLGIGKLVHYGEFPQFMSIHATLSNVNWKFLNCTCTSGGNSFLYQASGHFCRSQCGLECEGNYSDIHISETKLFLYR